jgi:hypothetical protein
MINPFSFNKLLINLISKSVFEKIIIRSMETMASKPMSKSNKPEQTMSNESSNNTMSNAPINVGSNVGTNERTNEPTLSNMAYESIHTSMTPPTIHEGNAHPTHQWNKPSKYESTSVNTELTNEGTNVNAEGTDVDSMFNDMASTVNDKGRISFIHAPLSGDSRLTNDIRNSRGSLNSNSANSLETEDSDYDSDGNLLENKFISDRSIQQSTELNDQSADVNNSYLRSERVQSRLTEGQMSDNDKKVLGNFKKFLINDSDSEDEGNVNTTVTANTNLDNEIKASPLPPKPVYSDRADLPNSNRDISVDENKSPWNIFSSANNYWNGLFKDKPKPTTSEPLINTDNTEVNPNVTSNEVLNKVIQQGNEFLGQAQTKEIIDKYSEHGNSFTIPANTPDAPIMVPDTHVTMSPTILAMDQAMKLTVSQLDDLSTRLGIQVEKSVELASKWDGIKTKLDVYIKSLDDVNYKRIFKYTACTMAILYFVYQMGIYRKLPDFFISIASHIPLPNFKGSEVPVPKPSIESTFNKVMDIPLTPLTIVTGVGSIVTLLGILKVSMWIIRKLKK